MSIVLVVVGYLVFSSIVGSIIGRFIRIGKGSRYSEKFSQHHTLPDTCERVGDKLIPVYLNQDNTEVTKG